MKPPERPYSIIIIADPVPMLTDKALGASFTYAAWKRRQKARRL